MPGSSRFPLVAVDIGNSRIKLGDFELPLAEPLPRPARTVSLEVDWDETDLAGFPSGDPAGYSWLVASVNRPAANRLLEWLRQQGVERVKMLAYTDLPLAIELPRPDLVGIDRLAGAVAANRLRAAERPAIVIGLGSAITVDLVSATGAFAGGAILPGVGMGARALHEFTDLLPLVEVVESPPALGTSTLTAMQSGLYWGATGAVRELVARLSAGSLAPDVFLTGGAAPTFAKALAGPSGGAPRLVPELILAGIALAAVHAAPAKEKR